MNHSLKSSPRRSQLDMRQDSMVPLTLLGIAATGNTKRVETQSHFSVINIYIYTYIHEGGSDQPTQ